MSSATWSLPFTYLNDAQNDAFDDDDVEESQRWGKEATLFAIDCAQRMMQSNEEGNIPFREALKTVVQTLRAKASQGASDLLAVLFFNVDKSDPSQMNKHNQLFVELSQPTADIILSLSSYLDDTNGLDQFLAEFGSLDRPCPLPTVFHSCAKAFPYEKSKRHLFSSMRVILITNDADPNAYDNGSFREASRQRAKDLRERKIAIEVLGLGTAHHPFDWSIFYDDILSGFEEQSSAQHRTYRNSEELAEAMRRTFYSKRALAHLKWNLCEGSSISVKLYSLLMETKLNRYSYADQRTNLTVVPKTTYYYMDHGKLKQSETSFSEETSNLYKQEQDTDVQANAVEVHSHDIQFAYEFGGEMVVFTKNEIKAMKTLGSTGLELFGFKPLSALKIYENLRAPYFLFPDEEIIRGSVTCFTAMLKQMSAKGVMAICRMQNRQQGLLRCVALIPQLEVLNEKGFQQTPPGFQVIVLPFADDIRDVPRPLDSDKQPVAPLAPLEGTVDVMKSILERIVMDKFDPHEYQNPVIERMSKVIEAVALDGDLPEDIPDDTVPDMELFESCSNLFDDLKELVPFVEIVKTQKRAKNAEKETENEDKVAKKVKKTKVPKDHDAVDNSELEGDIELVEQALKSNSLHKLTVSILKTYLKAKGKKATGKKADLIEAIESLTTSE